MQSAIIAILISLAMGVIAWYVTNRFDFGGIKVSTRELIMGSIGSTVVLLLFAPLVEHLIINDKLTFKEYFNGVETKAVDTRIPCERDGDCTYDYSCDPYVVPEVYYTEDSEGHSHAHTRLVTKYHHCPYLKVEHEYTIQTTLGDYNIGGRYAENNKAGFRDEPVPANIPVGPPQFWLEAKNRIDSGKPGGVTKTHDYKNFLLASDQTILKSYSEDIEAYKKDGLLPDHTTNYLDPIYSYYLADKFHSVHLTADAKAWNEALTRLNGYLGDQLQGDVHMVAVNADIISDRDKYSQALFAYWKGPDFKKSALPKNAIAIVVGVKDNKVAWARATGGLPDGNAGLFLDIQNNLMGVDFTPDALIGDPHGAKGALATQLWGPNKFVRPCMECIQEKKDGYAYLAPDVVITGAERFWIVFVASFLSASMWAVFLYVDDAIRSRYGY